MPDTRPGMTRMVTNGICSNLGHTVRGARRVAMAEGSRTEGRVRFPVMEGNIHADPHRAIGLTTTRRRRRAHRDRPSTAARRQPGKVRQGQLVRCMVSRPVTYAATDGAGKSRPVRIRLAGVCAPVPKANARASGAPHVGPSVGAFPEREFFARLLL